MVLANGWQKAITIALLLFSLSLMLWTGGVLWQQSCSGNAGFAWIITTPCLSFQDIIPLLVAFGLWVISLVVWLANGKNVPIFFFLLLAGTLSAGQLSSIDSTLGGRLFTLLLTCLSPSLFYFHLLFLERQSNYLEHITLIILSGLAFILSIPSFLWSPLFIEQQPWFTVWRLGIRFTLVLSFILTTILLVREYHHYSSPIMGRRIRFITFGTLFAFTPLILLSLLPNTLGMPVYIPYVFTFPCLLLSPLTYAYTYSFDLVTPYREILNRVVANYLLIVLWLAICLVVITIVFYLNIPATTQWLLISAWLSICLLFIFAPLQATLKRLVRWVWEGKKNNYTDVMATLSKSLALALNTHTLQHLLLHELVRAMSLSCAALFLVQEKDRLTICGNVKFDLEKGHHILLNGQIATFLQKIDRPVTSAQLRQHVVEATLQKSEQTLLSIKNIALWLPLMSGKTVQGLLLVGPKVSDMFFTDEEIDILMTLSFQAGSAAHNIRLVSEVRAKQQELVRVHRQLLTTQEQERQNLARWLHDSIIQQLLGLTYQLAINHKQNKISHQVNGQEAVPTASINKVRQEILDLVTKLRHFTGDLRPAGLDELGLSAAIEGYVARLQREEEQEIPMIELSLKSTRKALPESVAICLFRVTQEGLRNALRHAEATHIQLTLSLDSEVACLKVCDNGRGFSVPTRLSQLVWYNHFGLVGISEQVHSVGGHFTIQSQPNVGTEILVQVPLFNKENDHE